MTMMSDLTQDLVEEILSRVPIASIGAVRSTCKGWNTLSKERILCKAEPKEQFLGFMIKKYKLCSMKFNLHGILNEDGLEFVDPSIKEVGILLNNRVEISKVFYCAGLLLCVTKDESRLVVWNPYLGQTRWINTKTTTGVPIYALGCDNNKNHKILSYFLYNRPRSYKIYDFKSDSWRALNVIPNWYIDWYRRGTSLDGNTYFWTIERKKGYDSDSDEDTTPYFLICFDFTAERFGKLLDLPFTLDFISQDNGILYCVKEEKLGALYQECDTTIIEIWITTKIEPNAVSWTPFLKVDIEPLLGLDFQFNEDDCCFFIDEEKKLAVVIHADGFVGGKRICERTTSFIIGENGYLKKVNLGEETYDNPLVCSYVPSSVQINQIAGREGRENKRKRKSKGKGRSGRDLTNKV